MTSLDVTYIPLYSISVHKASQYGAEILLNIRFLSPPTLQGDNSAQMEMLTYVRSSFSGSASLVARWFV